MLQFSRTALLLGEDGLSRLTNARVIVFGIGGVGGHCAEALARAGIGQIDLVDADTVSITNINRQLVALHSTIGMPKVQVMADRIADINPQCTVTCHQHFYLPDDPGDIDLAAYDYIIDCIDTVRAKLDLVEKAHALQKPVISAMGAGNKLDPGALRVSDISKTSVCPLARAMRVNLKKRNIHHLKCVYSTEPAVSVSAVDEPLPQGKRAIPGSTSFVPSVMGLMMAGQVIRDLALGEQKNPLTKGESRP